jgi:hypothetical protein
LQCSCKSLNTGIENLTEYRVRQWRARFWSEAKLSGESGPQREILRKDQPGLEGMAGGSKVVEQAAEKDQVYAASLIGQGRILLAEATEPAEQMGIAAQLGELEHLREIRLKIGEEVMGGCSIVSVRMRKNSEAGVKDLREFLAGQSKRWVRSHPFWGGDKRIRFCTARAYSRQTSWGAS